MPHGHKELAERIISQLRGAKWRCREARPLPMGRQENAGLKQIEQPESETQKDSRWVTSNSSVVALGGLPVPGPCTPTVWLRSVAVVGGGLRPACLHHGGDASPWWSTTKGRPMLMNGLGGGQKESQKNRFGAAEVRPTATPTRPVETHNRRTTTPYVAPSSALIIPWSCVRITPGLVRC
jgi:hypothetical protein